ncbi:MAG: hypothetical protein RMK29_01930 [Myxococcales bacterium]|nr:hypothetical protein [Myxococcota bacterium]MDW8280440.1 hypothetical protein [Myxococcales bacterium]
MSEEEAERRYQTLLQELRRSYPRFRLRSKQNHPLQRAIHRALQLLTLGKMRTYLSEYQTTLGQTVWVTADWDAQPALQRWVTLRHEAVHLAQFRRLGMVGIALLYLLVPLPVGLAWFRMRLEREAYEETLRALAEALGVEALREPGLRSSIIRQFTGPAYGWMWPFPRAVARWYDRFVASLSGQGGCSSEPDSIR